MPKLFVISISLDYSTQTDTAGSKIRLSSVELSHGTVLTSDDLTFITSKIDRNAIYSGSTIQRKFGVPHAISQQMSQSIYRHWTYAFASHLNDSRVS